MIEMGHRLRFAQKAFANDLGTVGQNLDRDLALQDSVRSVVDVRHSAASDQLVDFVALRDDRSDPLGHRNAS